MRRDNLFWGTALILFGILLYLQAQGITGNIFQFFWPLALILVGSWLILNVYWRPAPSTEESFMIPLGSARSARFSFSHGASRIEISGGAPLGQALVGSSAMGVNHRSYVEGDQLEVKVEAGPSFIPLIGPSAGVWRFQLTQEVPLTLIVESGATSQTIDLRDVQATRIELETGASSSNLTMPARGKSLLEVDSGAASVNVLVPEGTAARIRIKDEVGSVNVDTNRFPRLDSGLYQSSDFDMAVDRAEIHIDSGLGSISVR